MDALRSAGQLNLESPWTKVVHGDRAYYGRGGEWDEAEGQWKSGWGPRGTTYHLPPKELLLGLPVGGVKDVRVSGAEDFERQYTKAERLDEVRSRSLEGEERSSNG